MVPSTGFAEPAVNEALASTVPVPTPEGGQPLCFAPDRAAGPPLPARTAAESAAAQP